jgi:hypothetical protein
MVAEIVGVEPVDDHRQVVVVRHSRTDRVELLLAVIAARVVVGEVLG